MRTKKKIKVLVIGANGMIGSTVLRVLSEKKEWDVFGTTRNLCDNIIFPPSINERIISGIDVLNPDSLVTCFAQIHPTVVINCAGITKHKPEVNDRVLSIAINALMPHRLATLCKIIDARLIHISTDCVFSGEKGGYTEEDITDAHDVYGKSKALGELEYAHSVTLRTSTIGHELQSQYGLLDWFLSQEGKCKGFSRAIFSGLPTVVLAQVIRDIVIPRSTLSGLYHIAAEPINKYELLTLIANAYGKKINIIKDDKLVIDRSLNSDRFQIATGYVAPGWPELINLMRTYG